MKKVILLFVIIPLIIINTDAQVQWTPSNGLCGGNINAIVTRGSVMVVATEKNGVFVSEDRGVHWSNRSNGLPESNATAVTSKGEFLFVGTANNGVYRSSDMGNTWLPANKGMEKSKIIKMVSNAACIIAAVERSFYKSYDNGVTWTQHAVPGLLMDLKVDGENFYIVDFAEGAYISIDNGLEWENIYGSVGVSCVDADGAIIVVGGAEGVYRSTDAGNSWETILKSQSRHDNIAINGEMIVLGPSSISTDNGRTWSNGGNYDFSFTTANSFYVDNSVIYACCTGSILLKRAMQDTTWTLMNNSVLTMSQESTNFPVAVSGNNQILAVGSYEKVYSSFDMGQNWEHVYSIKPESLQGIRVFDSIIVALGHVGYAYSSDKGKTWVENTEWKEEYIYDIKSLAGKWYLATEKDIYRSTDKGKNWEKLSIPFVLQREQKILQIEIKGSTLYISSVACIYKSVDNGDSWLPVYVPDNPIFNSTSINSFAITDEDVYMATDDGLAIQNYSGETWDGLIDKYRSAPVNKMIAYGETVIVAFDNVKKIFVKTKDKKWQAITTPNTVYDMSIINGQLFIVSPTDDEINIWKADINSVIPNTEKEWVRTNALLNSVINDMEWSNSVQFAATEENGIYKSSDNGNTWIECSNGLPTMNITKLASNGNVLFAGSAKGLFKSTDNGNSWLSVDHSIANEEIQSLFSYKGRIFVSVPYAIYVSSDNGVNWAQFQDGINEVFSVQFAANENTLFAASTFGSVFSLPDGALAWTRLTEEDFSDYIVDVKADGKNVYALFLKDGFARSTDNGKTWTIVNDSASKIEINTIEVHNGNIYVGNSVGVHISRNHGSTWEDYGLLSRSITSLDVHENYLYAGTNRAMIWKTNKVLGTNPDNKWKQTNAMLNSRVSNLIWNEGTMYAGTQGHGIYKTVDDGDTWIGCSNGLSDMNIKVIAENQGALYVGCGKGLFKSSDNGNNWHSVNQAVNNKEILSLYVHNGKIYVSVENAVYLSSDGGASWIQYQNGINEVTSVYFTAANGTLFAGTSSGEVYGLTEDVNTWKKVTTNKFDETIIRMESDGQALYAVFQKNGFARSTDKGKTWTIMSNSTSKIEIKTFVNNKGKLYVGNSTGVYVSSNRGNTWEEYGLLGNSITSLAIHDNRLYAGMEGGKIWKASLEENTTNISEKIYDGKRNEISIFPNPASDKITIRMPEMLAGVAQYTITNQLGAVVCKGTIPINGDEVSVSVSNLQMGLYTAILENNVTNVQKKFIIIR